MAVSIAAVLCVRCKVRNEWAFMVVRGYNAPKPRRPRPRPPKEDDLFCGIRLMERCAVCPAEESGSYVQGRVSLCVLAVAVKLVGLRHRNNSSSSQCDPPSTTC